MIVVDWSFGAREGATTMATISEQVDAARLPVRDRSDELLERLAQIVGAQATIRTVFGDPIREGDTTVIPVAKVRWGFGGGGGRSEATPQGGPAAGTGGGGGVAAEPVGYLEIRAEGATFRRLSGLYPSPAFLIAAGVALGIVLRSLSRLLGR